MPMPDTQNWVVEEVDAPIPPVVIKKPSGIYSLYKAMRVKITSWLITQREEDHINYATAQKKDPANAHVGPSDTWQNWFPNFLINLLSETRQGLTVQPKDAFWLMGSITKIIPKGLYWLYNKITIPVQWLFQQPWVKAVAPFIPFVGLVVGAGFAIKNFYRAKNKNIPTIFKFMADISSITLLGVGLGFLQWGGVAAAMTIAPYLIMAATACVLAVGLVRTGSHFYKAYTYPENRRTHLLNAGKEILHTFINATSFVLTLFGIKAAQLTSSNIPQANLLYQNTIAPLTDSVLGAAGALLVAKIAPRIPSFINSIKQNALNLKRSFTKLIFGSAQEVVQPEAPQVIPVLREPQSVEQLDPRLQADIATQIKRLRSQIAEEKPSASTHFIQKRIHDMRIQKINFLTELQNETETSLDSLKRKEKALLKTNPRAYQSFWCNKGKTQELAERVFNVSEKRAGLRS